MIPLRRRGDPHTLLVGMTGVKMGDRLLQIGCAHGGRLAAVAAKVGLSGRATAVVPDEASALRAQKGAEAQGVLVEVVIAPPTALPADPAAWDVVVIDNTGGLLSAMRAEDRVATLRGVLRALRPGGRAMVVGPAPRAGLAALLSRAPAGPPIDSAPLLEAEGFRSVRTLAEREGFVFVEGVKART